METKPRFPLRRQRYDLFSLMPTGFRSADARHGKIDRSNTEELPFPGIGSPSNIISPTADALILTRFSRLEAST